MSAESFPPPENSGIEVINPVELMHRLLEASWTNTCIELYDRIITMELQLGLATDETSAWLIEQDLEQTEQLLTGDSMFAALRESYKQSHCLLN